MWCVPRSRKRITAIHLADRDLCGQGWSDEPILCVGLVSIPQLAHGLSPVNMPIVWNSIAIQNTPCIFSFKKSMTPHRRVSCLVQTVTSKYRLRPRDAWHYAESFWERCYGNSAFRVSSKFNGRGRCAAHHGVFISHGSPKQDFATTEFLGHTMRYPHWEHAYRLHMGFSYSSIHFAIPIALGDCWVG